MDPAVSFGDLNFGLQVGNSYGPITAEIRLPSSLDEKLPVVHGAAFDSYMNQHEDSCLPGTRVDIIQQIEKWPFSPQGRCIFWLNGMAGTGKSTISRTVAMSFKHTGSLGASFFFKRNEGDRGDAMKLFPTISRQLASSIPELIPSIEKSIQEDPGIAAKAMKEQFDRLLLQPLLSLTTSRLPPPTVIIVIDALDECDADNDIRLILQLLPQLHKSSALRLRVFLTSRPDLPIRLGFSRLEKDDYRDMVLHETAKDAIQHDISLFLNHRLSDIRKERDLPSGWPGSTNIQSLVTFSVPLFIFAATICRIFEDPYWDPVDSLTEILAHRNDRCQLDGTYLPVLDRLLKEQSEKQNKQLVQQFQQVIGAIILLESPLSVGSLSKLIGLPKRLIYLRLSPLHSVLNVPDDEALPVRLFHLSFRDFLLDPETRNKTRFWVDHRDIHHTLAMQCLLMCQNLRKNICRLPSDGTKRADVDRRTVDRYISPELQYACRYWAHHLVQCTDLVVVAHDALLFLQKRFLHWMEAMSLLGLISEVVGTINLLQSIQPDSEQSAVSEFLHDAKRFILKNRQIADEAPLQLYCSGLIFAPRKSVIRREFQKDLPKWIYRSPRVEESWSAELQALEGHSDSVQLVTFSPDGRLLASSSHDKTVRLWDTMTGALQQTLKGDPTSVQMMAFSPNSRLLASSSDKIIRIWDTTTGVQQQTLEGHSDSVNSVVCSPNGFHLASGSNDKIIRLWDIPTGALQQIFGGHSGSINSVAFSPDGRLIASGSNDKTVRLWNATTNSLHQILQGHPDAIQSVVFSSDGRLLASSSNKLIRLWDSTKGTLKQTLEGYSGLAASVTFSPEGRLLASGSYDKTVRVWNTTTGALQQTLRGHSDSVQSVFFSPDGRLLASGSNDETVQLWDTTAGARQQTLDGHSGSVNSVTFSPDSRLLVSCSYDKTVRFWDTTPSGLQQTLKGHSSCVWSMAFSPDSRLLASCSNDTTVLLWDTMTGAPTHTLEGHVGSVRSVVFSPDGRLLASASNDTTIRLWNTTTGALEHILEGHLSSIWSIAFSPDGRSLSSGSHDKTIHIWDITTSAQHQILEGHSGSVRSVAFSPDGRLLASGSNDTTVRLWDITTGALQQTLKGHLGSVRSVAFLPDGRLLASSSNDTTVRLWDNMTGALMQTHSVKGLATGVEFSQDGSYLSTSLDVIDIQPKGGNPTSSLPKSSLGISVVQEQWVTMHDEHVLWLPVEFRPSCSAMKDSMLALGHVSGWISFMEFRL